MQNYPEKNNLVRKQFFLSQENVEKLDQMVNSNVAESAAEAVRIAIDVFDSKSIEEETKLMELVTVRLDEAIENTRKTREELSKTLKKLKKS